MRESKCCFLQVFFLTLKGIQIIAMVWRTFTICFSFIYWLHKSIHSLIFLKVKAIDDRGSPFTVPWSAACHLPKALLQIKIGLDSLNSRVTLWKSRDVFTFSAFQINLARFRSKEKMFFLIASPENSEFSEIMSLWSLSNSKDMEIVNDSQWRAQMPWELPESRLQLTHPQLGWICKAGK